MKYINEPHFGKKTTNNSPNTNLYADVGVNLGQHGEVSTEEDVDLSEKSCVDGGASLERKDKFL